MSEIDGPDFICIGMPKAGTGWLYDQLDACPDFWMPPVKELVYLTQRQPQLEFLNRRGRRRGGSPRERLLRRDPKGARDLAFMAAAGEARGKPMDLPLYAALFRGRDGLLSGDVSPPYSGLKDETVLRLDERFPGCKIVFLIRDPVARAWSSLSMTHRRGAFSDQLLREPAKLRDFVRGSKQVGSYFATEIAARWRRCAPRLPFRHFFFDDIVERPESVRREILTFLGADPEKQGRDVPASYNRKAELAKLVPNAEAERVLVDYFADELRASAALFGGRACDWPAKYGVA